MRSPGAGPRVDPDRREETLILVRHSAPEIDPDRSAHEWPLSAEGRRLSERLAERLAPFAPDGVFSSAEPKAEDTAAIVARALGLPQVRMEDLGEHARRSVPFYRDEARFVRRVRELFERPEERVFGEESAEEARERFARAIEAVRAHRARRPVVVTHGSVLSLYLARALDRTAWDIWRELSIPCFVVLGGGAEPSVRHVDIDAPNEGPGRAP